MTAAQLENQGYLGSLVTVEVTATKIEYSNGLIQTIMVKDDSGQEARVFIDGYITTAKDVENAAVGCHVKATGLASYDDTFVLADGTPVAQRIRIRDRADVVCTAGETPVKTWNIFYFTDGGVINGSVALIFDEAVERCRRAGCDFSGCTTDEDYLAAMEAFEDAPPADTGVSDQTRIADALEDMVALSLPDAE